MEPVLPYALESLAYLKGFNTVLVADLRLLFPISIFWWAWLALNKLDSTGDQVGIDRRFLPLVSRNLSIPLLLWALFAVGDTLKIWATSAVLPENTVFVQLIESLVSLVSLAIVVVVGSAVSLGYAVVGKSVTEPWWVICPALIGVFSVVLIQEITLFYWFLLFARQFLP